MFSPGGNSHPGGLSRQSSLGSGDPFGDAAFFQSFGSPNSTGGGGGGGMDPPPISMGHMGGHSSYHNRGNSNMNMSSHHPSSNMNMMSSNQQHSQHPHQQQHHQQHHQQQQMQSHSHQQQQQHRQYPPLQQQHSQQQHQQQLNAQQQPQQPQYHSSHQQQHHQQQQSHHPQQQQQQQSQHHRSSSSNSLSSSGGYYDSSSSNGGMNMNYQQQPQSRSSHQPSNSNMNSNNYNSYPPSPAMNSNMSNSMSNANANYSSFNSPIQQPKSMPHTMSSLPPSPMQMGGMQRQHSSSSNASISSNYSSHAPSSHREMNQMGGGSSSMNPNYQPNPSSMQHRTPTNLSMNNTGQQQQRSHHPMNPPPLMSSSSGNSSSYNYHTNTPGGGGQMNQMSSQQQQHSHSQSQHHPQQQQQQQHHSNLNSSHSYHSSNAGPSTPIGNLPMSASNEAIWNSKTPNSSMYRDDMSVPMTPITPHTPSTPHSSMTLHSPMQQGKSLIHPSNSSHSMSSNSHLQHSSHHPSSNMHNMPPPSSSTSSSLVPSSSMHPPPPSMKSSLQPLPPSQPQHNQRPGPSDAAVIPAIAQAKKKPPPPPSSSTVPVTSAAVINSPAAPSTTTTAVPVPSSSAAPPTLETEPEVKPPRVDLKVRKQSLDALLGDLNTQQTYWNLIEKYLLVKLSKKELDDFVIEKLGYQNIHVHNDFVLAVLQNAYSDELPPKPSKKKPMAGEPTANATGARTKPTATTPDTAESKSNDKAAEKQTKVKVEKVPGVAGAPPATGASTATGTVLSSEKSKEGEKDRKKRDSLPGTAETESKEKEMKKSETKDKKVKKKKTKEEEEKKNKLKPKAKANVEDEVSSVAAWLSSPDWFKNTLHRPMAHFTKHGQYFHQLDRARGLSGRVNENMTNEYGNGGGRQGQIDSWNVHPANKDPQNLPVTGPAPSKPPPPDGLFQQPKRSFNAFETGTIAHTQKLLTELYQPRPRAKSHSPRVESDHANGHDGHDDLITSSTSAPISNSSSSNQLATAGSLVTSILPSTHTSAYTTYWDQHERDGERSRTYSLSSGSRKRSRSWEMDEMDMDDDEVEDDLPHESDADSDSDGLDAYERLADPDTQAYLSSILSQPIPDRELIRRRLYLSALRNGIRHVSEPAITFLEQATQQHLKSIITSIMDYARPKIHGPMGRVASAVIPITPERFVPDLAPAAAAVNGTTAGPSSTTGKPILATAVASNLTPTNDVILVPANMTTANPSVTVSTSVPMDVSTDEPPVPAAAVTPAATPSQPPPRVLSVLIPSSPLTISSPHPLSSTAQTTLATVLPDAPVTSTTLMNGPLAEPSPDSPADSDEAVVPKSIQQRREIIGNAIARCVDERYKFNYDPKKKKIIQVEPTDQSDVIVPTHPPPYHQPIQLSDLVPSFSQWLPTNMATLNSNQLKEQITAKATY